jgi:putative nucleotidyltransferase with HDIG domain
MLPLFDDTGAPQTIPGCGWEERPKGGRQQLALAHSADGSPACQDFFSFAKHFRVPEYYGMHILVEAAGPGNAQGVERCAGGMPLGDCGEELMPDRDEAWVLLCEYTQNENLRKHALAVEACVRAYAGKFGADEELWGLAGLLHDFDYERWPNNDHHPTQEHPYEGSKTLRERGYPEEVIRAILSHADYTGVPRQTALEHTLFACDELAGFLVACALVKPGKSIFEVETDSVKRKLKDKAFARGVNRQDVLRGAEELGVPLDEHIGFCIEALRGVADRLGLQGKPSA